jgi:hypothetical protein
VFNSPLQIEQVKSGVPETVCKRNRIPTVLRIQLLFPNGAEVAILGLQPGESGILHYGKNQEHVL